LCRYSSDEERESLKVVLAKVLKTAPMKETELYAAAEEEALMTRLNEASSAAAATAAAAAAGATTAAAAADARSAKQDAADAAALSDAMAWTPAMRRLFSLVEACLLHKEPALLVGETGCGKTSVCQLLALLRGQKLRILNCHQHTETGDFLVRLAHFSHHISCYLFSLEREAMMFSVVPGKLQNAVTAAVIDKTLQPELSFRSEGILLRVRIFL
jgi:ATPase subunit of ABC transporter with duplicated ATPase domains